MHVRKVSLAVAAMLVVACGTEGVVSMTSAMSVLVEVSGSSVDTAFGLRVNTDTTVHPLTAGVASSYWVEEGSYTLELVHVADNCTVGGENPRTVQVSEGETVSVTFQVACTADGHIKVTVVTTGEDRDDMYTLAFNGDDRTVLVGPNQFVLLSLPAATYSVELRDVAANCSVAGANPVSVDVVPGDTVSTGFSVSCSAW